MIEIACLAFLSPLLSGIISKIKNNLRFRQGPSIFQPYFNLSKYFSKEEVVSSSCSWLFRLTPYIVFAATLSALLLISFNRVGDLIAVIFLFSLARFFLALAGLDPATTFGGMGSSREMFIASLVEPVAMLSVFAIALSAKTTNLTFIFAQQSMSVPTIMATLALFLVALAETGRIPIDNQETHLELTMIHEAMVLEYSGRSLGLLELAGYFKQVFFFWLISSLILPGFNEPVFLIIKMLVLCLVVAAVEVSLAKMRLFRVVDFLSFAGILSAMAIVALVLGA
ncbi:hypothetical protein A2291_07025 [candidate division WOR-1 bacterium RIFOXYB2_FULL_42_35]|uniref:Formate hydrogenlyase n=1 Tax=candidate division WOR-1 bacterium RIFOXYC2_FULL_41_25 TaxID=1802586 RepID=A0A1F4TRT9_UNCSA|nr:MAG: hypothetical protein A2247_04865 [candidate division WOR-1 bacterium RIFOXYA2_FULL_41_14]OGC25609.1 MAG: hypothetical protein A2291_07025 [candidate division WOR-1 bacterium RIFOXYB2_FULL_42_35]OGC35319.1 MAG: hypothetical protein A2462_02490 [candidate division WOR-1 bacterium RIFOXYC2_FULL_41_25]OGC41969.1 MAG: hypothetical protein A2548_07035 [candidate division WOR-1 bacterium RIFOXYD2_FULL_41_8]